MQLQVRKVSVNSLWGKNELTLPPGMQLAKSAGVQATLFAGKSKKKRGDEGARSSRHG